MQEEMSRQDLQGRFALIEGMIAEGRRTTERWGWVFVLWGVAYYVAMAWAAWGPKKVLAWPVTMIVAAILTVVPIVRRQHLHAGTTMGRAVGSVWAAMGIALFVLMFSIGFSGRFELHVFVATVAAMMGVSNAASGLILRWKMQFACAIVWWIAAVVVCFGSDTQVMGAFVVAIFFCQIVFGIYGMTAESRKLKTGAPYA